VTHPSELLAAAHAGSFSMALSDELRAAGYPVHRIDAAATVTMECVATRWTMTRVHLEVIATMEQGEEFDFVGATLRAKANCPVSRLLSANISMEAGLKRGLVSDRLPLRKAAKRRVEKPGSSKAGRVGHVGNGA
jgi:osmotically inducible protein OsmC